MALGRGAFVFTVGRGRVFCCKRSVEKKAVVLVSIKRSVESSIGLVSILVGPSKRPTFESPFSLPFGSSLGSSQALLALARLQHIKRHPCRDVLRDRTVTFPRRPMDREKIILFWGGWGKEDEI